jgi:hypothetical protein
MSIPTTPITDMFGREIKPGDIIAYGHDSCGVSAIQVAVVKKVERVPSTRFSSGWTHKITARAVDNDFRTLVRPPKLYSKDSILRIPDKMMVIEKGLLSPEFKKLLDEARDEWLAAI